MIYKVYNDDTWTETETAVSPPGSILPCFSWSMFSSSFTRRSKDTYLLLLSDKCCNFELTLKVQCRYVSSLASWVCCSDCCCCPLTSSGAAAPQEVSWRWSWRRWRGRFSAAAAATIRRWLLCLVSVGGEHICNWCYRISPHLMAAHLHLITGTQIPWKILIG